MKKRKGFTMVELMVVIIIMAILGLAIIPALMGSSEKAKYSRAWNDLNALSNAFTAYYGHEGNLPTISATDGKGLNSAVGSDNLFQSFLGTPLANLKDPWGEEYQVVGTWTPATGKGHIIVYVKPGTGDSASASFGTGISVNAKKDPYNDNMPMAKLIINVN